MHEKNLGYDVTSVDVGSGQLRLIEVKGLAAETGTILLTPNERRVAEDAATATGSLSSPTAPSSRSYRSPLKTPHASLGMKSARCSTTGCRWTR